MRLLFCCAALAALAAPMAAAETYSTTGVSIEHAAAIVTIIPEDRSNVDVTIAGGSRLPAPAVRVQGDDLVIDGGLRNRVRGCTSRLGSAPRVRIAGVGVVSRDELPRITVRAPRTLDLAIGGAVYADIGASAGGRVTLNGCGDTSMEAAAGQLHLTLNGSGDVEASRVGGPLTAAVNGSGSINVARADADATLRLNGSGELELGAVAGALDGRLNGSGNMSAASVGQGARISLNGSGDVEVGSVSGSLDADLRGSGNINVASVAGESVSLSLTSSGDIAVRGGSAGRLDAVNTGSGNLRFAGVAESSRLRLTGSGDIAVADAGRVEQLVDSGSGSTRLGQ